MPNWLESMQQTFEYYVVDPGTWKDVRKINNVKSCSITRDLGVETLGSATIDVAESLGECYIRVYLITIQNGVTEKFPLGTFLVQTPSSSFDGKTEAISLDAYTPLLELKETQPPLGYSVRKNENVMDMVYRITSDNVRAPVVKTDCKTKLYNNFVADPEETWISFLYDLMSNARYEFALDELGRILYSPKQDIASLQPVFTYTDDNTESILYPDISLDRDMYNIPNVVEVLYSSGDDHYYAKVINDDPNSPLSTVSRGRPITRRVTDLDLIGNPTDNRIQQYAKQLLQDLSSVEYTISYKHGYVPVRIGDCVRLNYTRRGFNGIKAKVISQKIDCVPGCPVSETAVFTNKLWG